MGGHWSLGEKKVDVNWMAEGMGNRNLLNAEGQGARQLDSAWGAD